MKSKDSLMKYLEAINKKEPITINYGKGFLSDDDIKDYAKWDDEIKAYRDETGIWDTKLLIEIAKGNVEGMKLEIGE